MSFSLYAVVCKGIPEEKTPARPIEPGQDAFRNPQAAWALELRSRRALSSQVRSSFNEKNLERKLEK